MAKDKRRGGGTIPQPLPVVETKPQPRPVAERTAEDVARALLAEGLSPVALKVDRQTEEATRWANDAVEALAERFYGEGTGAGFRWRGGAPDVTLVERIPQGRIIDSTKLRDSQGIPRFAVPAVADGAEVILHLLPLVVTHQTPDGKTAGRILGTLGYEGHLGPKGRTMPPRAGSVVYTAKARLAAAKLHEEVVATLGRPWGYKPMLAKPRNRTEEQATPRFDCEGGEAEAAHPRVGPVTMTKETLAVLRGIPGATGDTPRGKLPLCPACLARGAKRPMRPILKGETSGAATTKLDAATAAAE